MLAYFIFYGNFDIMLDSSLPLLLRIVMVGINMLSCLFIAMNLFLTADLRKTLYYSIGIILTLWYLWYTPQDIMALQYSAFVHVEYVAIDSIMLLYILIGSMRMTFLEQKTMYRGYLDPGKLSMIYLKEKHA